MDRMYSNSQAGAQQALNLAEIFLRGAARMLDLQTAAARAVLQTQGRSAAILGAPDWSAAFNGRSDEQLSHLFETSADQSVRFLRTTNEAMQQVQQQLGALLEQQTQQVTEQMRRSMDELVRRSQDGVEQMGRTSDEMMQRARRMSDEAGREGQRAQAAQQAETSSASSGIITPGGEAAGTAEERTRARRNA
jgi:DNA anti-recombination protein RmuC